MEILTDSWTRKQAWRNRREEQRKSPKIHYSYEMIEHANLITDRNRHQEISLIAHELATLKMRWWLHHSRKLYEGSYLWDLAKK